MALLALLACYFPIWGLLTMCDARNSGIPLSPGTKGLLDSFYQLCLVFLRIGIPHRLWFCVQPVCSMDVLEA